MPPYNLNLVEEVLQVNCNQTQTWINCSQMFSWDSNKTWCNTNLVSKCLFFVHFFQTHLERAGNVLKRLLTGQNFSDIFSILCSYLLHQSLSDSLSISTQSDIFPYSPSVWNKINQFTLLVFESWIQTDLRIKDSIRWKRLDIH